ncbi:MULTISPECIES: response regulator transcription factor [Methylosinus]|uniref:DNA-binding response regulator n=1 Tax=Methylosinus trichosporium (strain ATCC 35070 / NCIMB 11131 / UNIQEM 75 / OB3b) TaxID=595536 RepID=A0A2D2CZX7_METT3|nr:MULTISPECIES: LuxR C-terminal-related transcriptional regulator [Methylosinus]ATQ68311.1 DNA-binding response regulator [Methylosinus trichosporium OB3b]OBS50950.1 DNA-binding response regulator [Methylosinus sp. 3S-1]
MNYGETIHICGIDPVVRTSLKSILEKTDYRVRLHDDAGRFFEAVEPEARGCVLAYVDMPDLIGLDFLETAKEHRIELPIIVITGQANVRGAIQVMKEGAYDLLELPLSEEKLVAAVQQAMTRRADFRAYRGRPRLTPGRLSTLTSRENDVLAGLVEGKLNKVIAHELGISARTVETHRSHIMTKMRVKSVADLVRISLGAPRHDPSRMVPPAARQMSVEISDSRR